jgi:hypothetical protein
MIKPVGGRGQKAPYTTSIVRVPDPLIPTIEKLIDDYREMIFNGTISNEQDSENYTSQLGIVRLPKDDVIRESKRVLSAKKSARLSVLKLLQLLYGDEITEEALK